MNNEIELYDVTNEGKGTIYVDFTTELEAVNAHPIKLRDLIGYVIEEQHNVSISPVGTDIVYDAKTYTLDNLRDVVRDYIVERSHYVVG